MIILIRWINLDEFNNDFIILNYYAYIKITI